ncbi:MAG: hypothetical protein WBP40_01725 [Candidatus Moraniibacteriota bacterium]
MNTALRALDEAVNTAVANELGEEGAEEKMKRLGISVTRTRTVAGFSVVSHAARDAGVDPAAAQLQHHLIEYRGHRQILEQKLVRVGVNPIATLPSRAWERLSRESGLIQMTPVGDTVAVNLSGPLEVVRSASASQDEAWKKAQDARFWRAESVVIFLVVCCLGLVWYYHAPIFLLIAQFIGFLGTIGVSAATSELTSETERHQRDLVQRDNVEAWIKKHEADGTLYKELFPGGVEPTHEEANSKSIVKIRICLPQPPADVQETIIRAQRSGLVLHTAAVPEAIAFAENLVDKVFAIHTEQEAERIANARLDPIVYVEEGKAVAILAQFGDFPIEQELVKKVIGSAFLA